jgi:phosphoenolpyruvate---glycerone phosphotransferase subunit DhaK
VLRLYGNYGGDNMNFDMAGEMVEMEDIHTTTVRVADDVASAPLAERSKRRGVAGLVYAYKIAGAKADQHATLDEVTAAAQKAADACRSDGRGADALHRAGRGTPTFEISETEMEIGMGIHGEPGVRRGPMRPADAIAEEMLALLLADMPLRSGDRVSYW